MFINEVHGSLEASPPIPKAVSTELRGLEASGRGIPKAISTELLPSSSEQAGPGVRAPAKTGVARPPAPGHLCTSSHVE